MGSEIRQLTNEYEKMFVERDKIVKSNLDVQLAKMRERAAQKSNY